MTPLPPNDMQDDFGLPTEAPAEPALPPVLVNLLERAPGLAGYFTPRRRIMLFLVALCLAVSTGRDGLEAAALGVRGFLPLPSNELEIAYGAFYVGFGLALSFGGFAIDYFGARKSLLVIGCAAIGSILLTGLAWSLTILMLLRFTLGLAAGALGPAVAMVFGAWLPPPERAGALGATHAAFLSGTLLAWPIVGIADVLGSWRIAFLVFGAGGGVWILAFYHWFRARPGQATTAPEPHRPGIHWKGTFAALRLPMLLIFIQSWGLDLCWHWLPGYLLAFWHLDIKHNALIGDTGIAAAIAGSLVGGFAADWIFVSSGNIKVARQIIPGVGFLLAALGLYMLPLDQDFTGIALWRSVALFGLQAAIVPILAMPLDISPSHPAVALSLLGLSGTLANLASPMRLADLTGVWTLCFDLVLGLIGFAVIPAFWLRPDRTIPDAVPKPAAKATAPGVAATKKKH